MDAYRFVAPGMVEPPNLGWKREVATIYSVHAEDEFGHHYDDRRYGDSSGFLLTSSCDIPSSCIPAKSGMNGVDNVEGRVIWSRGAPTSDFKVKSPNTIVVRGYFL